MFLQLYVKHRDAPPLWSARYAIIPAYCLVRRFSIRGSHPGRVGSTQIVDRELPALHAACELSLGIKQADAPCNVLECSIRLSSFVAQDNTLHLDAILIMSQAKVLYFSGEIPQGNPEGDQRELFRKLHLLSKERNHPVLASFLDCVTTAVKDECSHLIREQRDLLPCFESVLDLTDHVVELRRTPLGAAVERVLVIVFQLGSFIA